MAARRKKASARQHRKRSPRKRHVPLGRQVRRIGLSALLSFAVASVALHAPWQGATGGHNASTASATATHPAFTNFLHAYSTGFAQHVSGVVQPLFDWIHPERFSVHRFIYTPSQAVAAPADVGAPAARMVQTEFRQCPDFFPDTPPVVPASPALRELCFSAFAILHSGQSKTPVFVVQRLNRQLLERTAGVERTDRFYAEARLPERERARLNDYRGSGYSRGHMAPAADMHTDEAMAQSFSLANMVPQDQTHNGGAWRRIEQDTRKYVMRAPGDVVVFTGPVFDGQPERIGEGGVMVPRYLYKLVFDVTTGRTWVHWHENSPDTRAGRPISYDEFVRRTNLHLLPGLSLAQRG